MGIFKNKVEEKQANLEVDNIVGRYMALEGSAKRIVNEGKSVVSQLTSLSSEIEGVEGVDVEDLQKIQSLKQSFADEISAALSDIGLTSTPE